MVYRLPLFLKHPIRFVQLLRVQIAVDVVLPVPKPVHRDPITQGLHLLPYLGIMLLDPGLHPSLLLDVGRCIVPIAEAAGNISKSRRQNYHISTYISKSGL